MSDDVLCIPFFLRPSCYILADRYPSIHSSHSLKLFPDFDKRCLLLNNSWPWRPSSPQSMQHASIEAPLRRPHPPSQRVPLQSPVRLLSLHLSLLVPSARSLSRSRPHLRPARRPLPRARQLWLQLLAQQHLAHRHLRRRQAVIPSTWLSCESSSITLLLDSYTWIELTYPSQR